MNHSSSLMVGAFLFCGWGAGCTGKTAQFGDERAVSLANRPTEFGMSHRDRFGLRDMAASNGQSGNDNDGGSSARRYTAVVPEHWQSAPASQFRDLHWLIDGDQDAECYLTASVGGSLRANLQRWAVEQFGAEPLSDAAVAALSQHPLFGDPALLLELQGTFRGRADTKMLLLARHRGGQLQSTFRMTGPAAIVDRERANFLAAAASVAVDEGTGGGGGAVAGPSVADPGAGEVAAAPGHGASATPLFQADLPGAWTPMGDTGSRMLRHRFGNAGECYVGQLGGAVADMIGIWYGEMGKDAPDPAAIEALPTLPKLGARALLIDLTGEHRGMSGQSIADARLLVAVVGDENGVVFAKCLGPRAEVDQQVAAFAALCQSLRRVGS